ncbi:MAG: putative DNA binding domain-containing protein [Planctomycetes bacterium]|nr:putative DNA binding domain-containing protein [Planctomycetota bacterium]MBI3848305.1 putative DNA binding domain-containing protein [Planctomycetota bacterium]
MAAGDAALFTESELRELLQRGEGQFLVFKSLWDRSQESQRVVKRPHTRDLVAESVAAFANADGGTLFLGVDDDGTPSGHGYPNEIVEDLLSVSEHRLRPPVRCRSQRMTLDGHEILILQVPIAHDAVMVEANGFPYRIGREVVREPQEVTNARKEAYRRVGFEQRIRPEATLDDLDLDLAKRFLSGTVFHDRALEELLARYGLVLPRAGAFAVTNAALLLFGKAPVLRWHARAGIRFFRVAGRERRDGAARNVEQLSRIEPPLASAIPEAHRLLKAHVRRSEKLHDLFFREMPEYPEFAWQEAIINAFAHRDYEDQAREIEVWFFEDRLEVRSPGELVPPVTLERLRTRTPVHASRNPMLVRVLVEAGLMREEGEGIARMFEEMEASYLNAPEFALEAATFTVTLRNEPIFAGVSAEWQATVRQLPLSLAQRRVLVANPEGFTNEDYRRLNGVDRDDAYREIQEMVALGVVLAPKSSGRGAVYQVSREAAEDVARPIAHETNAKNAIPGAHIGGPRTWLADRVAALLSYFEKHPFLKNADYREMFDLGRDAAVRELRRLVHEQYLRMEDERRGSRYLPGPALQKEE